MVFCRGCGKEIHETAPTCPSCGAPQSVPKPQPSITTAPSIELESITDSWKMKFELLEKVGGVKMPNIKNLPFGEKSNFAIRGIHSDHSNFRSHLPSNWFLGQYNRDCRSYYFWFESYF